MRQMGPLEGIVAVAVRVQMVKAFFRFKKCGSVPFFNPPHDKVMRGHGVEPFMLAVVEALMNCVPDKMLQIIDAFPDGKRENGFDIAANRVGAPLITWVILQTPGPM